MSHKIEQDGKEIEVYTAEEVQARETAAGTAAKTAAEAEFGKTKAQIEAERDEARKHLNERTGEMKQFRKLNDETLAKLSVAERTIYDNGLIQEEERKKREDQEKVALDKQVDANLREKAGKDDKVLAKMKEMWAIIGIDARTPEDIERKAQIVIGAIRQAEPDLVAQAVGFGGSAMPARPAGSGDDKSFADTERGKQAAAELKLMTEPPKK